VLERLHQWRSRGHDQGLRLVYAANTRLALHDSEGLCPVLTRSRLVEASSAASGCENGALLKALGSRGVRILIDATADRGVARFHPQLLRSGIHVATACKLASGTSLDLWRDICSACAEKGAGFGDRATVGAGLPLLRSGSCAPGATGSTRSRGSCRALLPGCSTASMVQGPSPSW
jgi:homoserine dehydrogenase